MPSLVQGLLCPLTQNRSPVTAEAGVALNVHWGSSREWDLTVSQRRGRGGSGAVRGFSVCSPFQPCLPLGLGVEQCGESCSGEQKQTNKQFHTPPPPISDFEFGSGPGRASGGSQWNRAAAERLPGVAAPATSPLRQGKTPSPSLCGLHRKGGTEQTRWKPARVL